MGHEICVLAPDGIVAEQVSALRASIHMPFAVEHCNVDNCIDVARAALQNGTRVIVARGSMADRVRSSGLDLAVIEIPIAGYDLIDTMRKAKRLSGRVALVGFDNVLIGAEKIAKALGIELFTARVYSVEDSALGVRKAYDAGFRVVIGGQRVVEKAETLGMRALPLSANLENMRQVLLEAERMALVLKNQREAAARLAVTLDSIRDAIITFDTLGSVIFSNSRAERYFKLSQSRQEQAAGFVEGSGLGEAVRRGMDWNGEIVSWNGVHYVCTLNPVVSDMRTIGWVAVLQTGAHLESMEHKMRHTLHNKGHMAAYTLRDIVHASPVTRQLVETARFYAHSPSTVLLEGESGTGKELFAQGIHSESERRRGPFVAINCAAIPESLMESELFGYAEGAFTGARKGGKPGLFELAHQGTLFMDEIGDMPLRLQSFLLRVLEEKTVMRIGQGVNIPVDVRVICAVNKDLFQLVQQGRFRADLYYRLNVLRLGIPPLRQRPEDIAALTQHFLATLPATLNRPGPTLEPEGLDLLLSYGYSGNIRELRNILERIIVTSRGAAVSAAEIAPHLHPSPPQRQGGPAAVTSGPPPPTGLLNRETDSLILRTLAEAGNNKAETARRLGISQATLWRRLRRMGV